MNVKKVVTYVVIIGVMAAGVVAVSQMKPKKAETTGEVVENKTSVEAVVAKTSKKTTSMSYKATLDCADSAMVSSKLSAKVMKILFENGDTVQAGSDLIILDQEDLNNQLKVARNQLKASQNQLEGAKMQATNNNSQVVSAQNQLKNSENQLQAAQNQLTSTATTSEKLQNNLDNAQQTYDRTKELFEAGVETKITLDNAELALKSAKLDLESAQSNIDTLKLNIESAKTNIEESKNTIEKSKNAISIANNGVEATKIAIETVNINIANLQSTLANAVIKAPMSGIIDDKNVVLGQFVSPGASLATIKNIDTIDAIINVDQQNVASIAVGNKADVTVSGDNGDQTYVGTVKSIDMSADPSARSFTTKILIDNQGGALRPGIYAKVQLQNAVPVSVLELPIQVLLGNEGDYYVFTAKDGLAHKKSVTIGNISETSVEILSGIVEGESIISTNTSTLSDGTPIVVATGQGA